ncbi:MAG: hypothetical protein EOP07_04815 [Proteobacteria bacterium]|nr:MAG: hypothetical protein EOP07_04815 [Pseudomonadota bacterium]
MQKELADLLELLEDIGRVTDRFDDPDRGLVLRLRRQVGNLSKIERDTLRDAARASNEGYLGWLEVGVAKD